MNRTAFQIYGSKKTGIFQSTWDTTLVSALGGEQAAISATGTNWALNTGATNLNVGGYKHTAGSTTNLTTTLSAAIMQMYKITYTISSRTAGSVTINYGGVSTSGITYSASVDILAIATTVFSITPTSDFDGVISISVKQTSSATNQVKLPLPNIGTYNIWVDWGDGTYDNITSWNSIKTLHTYPAPGIYTVRITGDRFIWQFANFGDRLKIKTVSSWGKLRLINQSFQGCSNVTMSGITDVPDLTGVTSLQAAFFSCSKITTVGRMNEWNTSSVTAMNTMFAGSALFNQCIGGWNVSNVTNFEGLFNYCYEFNNGDNSTPLNNWTLNTTSPVTLRYPFGSCIKFNRYIGGWNTSKVTAMSEMFSGATIFNNGFDAGVGTGNQLKWDTSSCTDMSKMFYQAPAFNSNLGTGTTPWDVSKVTTFASMFALTSKFNNGDETDVTKSKITDWNIGGDASVINVNMSGMFSSALVFNRPIDNWNMTKVNDTSGMIAYSSAFNQPLSNWERIGSTMSNVTNMGSMFAGNTVKFNQDISNWNVSGVTNFSGMFSSTTLFNNGSDTNTNLITGRTGIDGWNINTASFVNMSSMFSGAGGDSYVTFNRPIGNWNTSKVTNMSNMFGKSGNGNHAFNQYIGDWDTSSVSNMSYMFRAGQGDGTTSNFNQDISKWNVSKVTDFSYMLSAKQFTNGSNLNINPITLRPGIDGWNINTVSNVVMNSMFQSATSFNQPIGSWNVSSVTNMAYMFYNATAFDQPLSNWKVGSVTTMNSMFFGAIAFNQDISTWERIDSSLSLVSDMNSMFQGATAFKQYIGNWNVSNVNNFGGFMALKTPTTFPSTYLDAIYNGWIVNGVKPNINISFGTAKYTAAGAIGRATLAAPPNGTGTWTITDGGQI